MVCAFPEEVEQLQTYFGPGNKQAYVRAYPAVDKMYRCIYSDHQLTLHI